MSRDLTRRDVLRASAAAAVGLAVAPAALASQKKPSEKIRFAMIGVGGRGGAHLEPAATFGEIVGLCDVDAQTRAKAMMNYPRAGSFADFRQMLETMDKHIDAVVVATPDHTHAVAAAMAMRMGKHVYCEKPLTRSIHEARQLAKIAKQAKVATQMGNQGTSTNDLRRAAAVIKSGGLGTVKEVHCWTNRAGGWWPQGVEQPKSARCPKHVDFDLWLGPSPRAAVRGGLSPVCLARLVALRLRRTRRHRLPLHEPAVHGPRPARPDRDSGADLRPQQGQLPRVVDRDVRIRRAGQPPRPQALLVRRRQTPLPRPRARHQVRRERLRDRRRQSHPLHARRVRQRRSLGRRRADARSGTSSNPPATSPSGSRQ